MRSAIVTSGVASFSTNRFLAAHPGDRRIVARLGDQLAPVLGDRRERVVVDLAAGHDRHRVVEQRDERAQNPRLRLAAQAEQDEVVPRQERVDDLRHDGVFVADDAGEQRSALAEPVEQVLAHFVLDRAECALGDAVRRPLERAECFGMGLHDLSICDASAMKAPDRGARKGFERRRSASADAARSVQSASPTSTRLS